MKAGIYHWSEYRALDLDLDKTGSATLIFGSNVTKLSRKILQEEYIEVDQ